MLCTSCNLRRYIALQDVATGQLEANTAKRGVQLRRVLADLGPAFIKVGQALSARPDLLPQPYLEVDTCERMHTTHSASSDCPAGT